MKYIGFLLLLPSFLFAQTQTHAGSQDHYKSFTELAQKNIEGVDYRITTKDNNSKILIAAFHGGFIEPGTTELVSAIAGDQFNFYTFEALKPGEVDEPSLTSSTLHLTSTNFDEPKLSQMVNEQDFCLGIHGFGGEEADFCVGGANKEQRKALVAKLSSAFPTLVSCELCCPPYNGTSKKNPINKCKQQGVQVEMSPNVRRKILADQEFTKAVSNVFRDLLKDL